VSEPPHIRNAATKKIPRRVATRLLLATAGGIFIKLHMKNIILFTAHIYAVFRNIFVHVEFHVVQILKTTTTLSALAVIVLSSGSAFAQTRVRFGPSGGLSDNSLAVHVAIEKGYYKAAGLAPEVVQFKGGGPALQALVSGSIEFCVCAPEHVVRLRARGIDGIVAYALSDRVPYALFAKPGSDIKSFADLKGKKIGITTAGSLTDNLVRLALKRAGLNPDRDVQIVSLGQGSAQKAAIDTGAIAAGMVSGFDALEFGVKGYVPVFDWRSHEVAALGLLARQSWVDANRDTARAVVKATFRATKEIIDNPAERVVGLKQLFPHIDDTLIQKSAQDLGVSTNKAGRFTPEVFSSMEADIIALEPELKPLDFKLANPELN
jgi:NitT/TauT family transport system substrate-binding protein